jgi:flavin-dependent dehydrogenase
MVPERRNRVKVLLFLDVGGSMDPHVRVCEELFSATKTEFRHLEYFYFHNCVYDYVWHDNARRRNERMGTLELLRTYGPDWKVIFVGDAAMTFDPLSSQGICRSLESGLLGARAIAAALDGDDSALLDWSFQNRQRFASHVQTRQAYYGLERRWPDSEFWRRRHAETPPVQRDSDYGKNAQSYVVALSSLPHSGPSSGRRSETPPRRPISLSDLPS